MPPVTTPGRIAAWSAALSAALIVGMAGTAAAVDEIDCADLTYQEDALAAGLDCPDLPRVGEEVPTTPPTVDLATTAPTRPAAPSTTPLGPAPAAGCAGFATQAESQAALERDRNPALDADADGIACEQHFGTDGQQVAVYPLGGVATGGTPAP